MTFTNEDLKRLKEDITNRIYPPNSVRAKTLQNTTLLAIIARLEAAEKVIEIMGSDPLAGEVSRSYEAWRKAAGK